MPSPPPMIDISSPSTSNHPNPISPPSKQTPQSTLWPLSSALTPNLSFALNIVAFLTAFSFLILLTLYLRRHFGRQRLRFDIERQSGLDAYARFGMRVFKDGEEGDAENYKLRNSPRRVKGLKGVKEGRGRVWEDWVGREMERGRERDRDRERRRDRERHLERGRQLWKSRAVGEIGMGPVGKL